MFWGILENREGKGGVQCIEAKLELHVLVTS